MRLLCTGVNMGPSRQGWLVGRACVERLFRVVEVKMQVSGWRLLMWRAVRLTSGIGEEMRDMTASERTFGGPHRAYVKCVREKSNLIDDTFSSKIHSCVGKSRVVFD